MLILSVPLSFVDVCKVQEVKCYIFYLILELELIQLLQVWRYALPILLCSRVQQGSHTNGKLQNNNERVNGDASVQKSEGGFSNIENCGSNQRNSPVVKSHISHHLLPQDAVISHEVMNLEHENQMNEIAQNSAESEDIESVEPSISYASLLRVLKLCGLAAPPQKFTYRNSNGLPIEYSGNKLTLREYLDFADVYIDDTALQVSLM